MVPIEAAAGGDGNALRDEIRTAAKETTILKHLNNSYSCCIVNIVIQTGYFFKS